MSEHMLFEQYRSLFPIMDKYIFLDNSGVAPVSSIVAPVIEKFLKEASTESSFVYDSWMEEVEKVRNLCSQLLSCSEEEIAFIKNTSHGISLVAGGLRWRKGDNVIIYEKEFPANIYPWLNLEKKGVRIKFIGSKEEPSLDNIERLTDEKTRIISVSSVQFTNGYMADLEAIGKFCRDNNIYFFVDAIQSLGAIPMDVEKFNIDFLAADGHKWLLSPEGTGIFYCNNELIQDVDPSLIGWKSVINESSYEKIDFQLKENTQKFEEASFNVMGILAMGVSISLLLDFGIENIMNRIHHLGDTIINCCLERKFEVITPIDKKFRAGIVSFRPSVDPDFLRQKLIENNVMVNLRSNAIRVSPHFYNNEVDILRMFTIIDSIIKESLKHNEE